MSEYVLSCCSSCDLNNDWVKKRDISYISFNVTMGDKQLKDDMGLTTSPFDMYEKMASGIDCKTSQVSMGEYTDYFESIVKEGKDIIHISLSSGLSGTLNAAHQSAEMVMEKYPDRRIIVIDSMAASSGYGLLMELTADKRDEGLSIDELAKWVEENRLYINHWFFSTDLTYYIKGGRVSKTAGMVGQVLNICPLLNVDYKGRLIAREKVRTKKKVVKRIVEKMVEGAEGGLEYNGKCFISDSDKELGKEVQALVEETFPQLKGKVEHFDIGCTIGAHTGPGTVALFFVGKERVD